MIIPFAGRRIDASDSKPPRFPFENIAMVKDRLKFFFVSHQPATLICSGACGADLLALDVAGDLGIYRKMIIPFAAQLFRTRSVIDRPGDWGVLFDRIYKELNGEDEVIVLNYSEDDDAAYEKTNIAILDRAEDLFRTFVPVGNVNQNSGQMLALIAWDGKSRETGDATAHFMKEARNRNIGIEQISTLK